MRILFMAQCYAPEDVSAAVLITELATDLAQRGHEVSFVTAAPSYPHGCVFPGYRNRPYQTEWLDNVRVVRTWSYISPRKTFWRRILNYGTFSATAFYGGLLAGKPDVVVNFSPPLPLGLPAWLLSRSWNVPWVLQLNDLYPEAAVAAGVLRNSAAINFFSAMERFFYRHTGHISLLSDGFRRNLLAKGVPAEKISVIPVWADPDAVRPLAKENSFRQEHGLTGQFVVMYAGNVGHTSSLEDVLVAASLLRSQPDLRFVIVGDGVKKAALEDFCREQKLVNVRFLPFQPREIFAEMLAAADVSLVTLNQNSSQTSLPSKTFNIMASARPIVSVTPPHSEIAQLVTAAGCGVNTPPGQPELLAESLLKLKSNRHLLGTMGQNGRWQLEQKYSRARCVNSYEQMLLNLCRKEQIAYEC
jgi:colanic acid biosynthesis glycosyl transferase WcaI